MLRTLKKSVKHDDILKLSAMTIITISTSLKNRVESQIY